MRLIRHGLRSAADRLTGPPRGLERVRRGAGPFGRVPTALRRLGESPVDLASVEAALGRMSATSPTGSDLGERRRLVPSLSSGRDPGGARPARPARRDEGLAAAPAAWGGTADAGGVAHRAGPSPRPGGALRTTDVSISPESGAPSVSAMGNEGRNLPDARVQQRSGYHDAGPGGVSTQNATLAASLGSQTPQSDPPDIVQQTAATDPAAAGRAGALSELVRRWTSPGPHPVEDATALDPGPTAPGPIAGPALRSPAHETVEPATHAASLESGFAGAPPPVPSRHPEALVAVPNEAAPAMPLDLLELALDEIVAREAEAHGLGGLS